MTETEFAQGGCACGHARYSLSMKPLFVHCCHCRWCQRETGASFALNAMIEATRVSFDSDRVHTVVTPSESGKGQRILRCRQCQVALWSHYAGAGDSICFVRVGTLDNPQLCPPDAHIFTESRQPWLRLPTDTPVFERFYRRSEVWPGDRLERLRNAGREDAKS